MSPFVSVIGLVCEVIELRLNRYHREGGGVLERMVERIDLRWLLDYYDDGGGGDNSINNHMMTVIVIVIINIVT